jgi:Protein of unknown function (DUF4232)
MVTRRSVRRTAAAVAVVGAAVAGSAVFVGTASAMPTDFNCTSGQIDTTLVAGDPGAGQRYASVQFTAKPGNRCYLRGALPLSLADAPGITVAQNVPADGGPLVTVSDGHPASMLLHWTGIEAPADQVRPTSVTVVAPASTDLRGDYSDPRITLPWNQGPLDDAPEAHTLTVNAVQPGAAQY